MTSEIAQLSQGAKPSTPARNQTHLRASSSGNIVLELPAELGSTKQTIGGKAVPVGKFAFTIDTQGDTGTPSLISIRQTDLDGTRVSSAGNLLRVRVCEDGTYNPSETATIAAGTGSRFGSDKLRHPLPHGVVIAVQAARHLRAAATDDDVSAIVLRVNSPGGAVTGSETIWREVVRARAAGKPVVASMGAVAASGGYYVSMAADSIVANAGTITGSIGVVTGKLVARDLKERLGVGSDTVRTNANADAWSINAPFTPEQHTRVEAEADLFYTDFVQRVADGRGMTIEAVDAIARGRVWTGADAAERGLVDELGGLRTAVRRAKVLAGLDAEEKVRIIGYPGSSLRDRLRPKASSQPAAASLPQAVAAVLTDSVVGVLDGAQRQFTGASALWLGDGRR